MNGLLIQRKKRNATLKEIALDNGISIQALSAYERGTREPSISMLKKLAAYYNCSIDELVCYENNSYLT